MGQTQMGTMDKTVVTFSAAMLAMGFVQVIFAFGGPGMKWGDDAPKCSQDNDMEKVGCHQYFMLFSSLFLVLAGGCGVVAGMGSNVVAYGAAVCGFLTTFLHF